jgi:hypothetical protein
VSAAILEPRLHSTHPSTTTPASSVVRATSTQVPFGVLGGDRPDYCSPSRLRPSGYSPTPSASPQDPFFSAAEPPPATLDGLTHSFPRLQKYHGAVEGAGAAIRLMAFRQPTESEASSCSVAAWNAQIAGGIAFRVVMTLADLVRDNLPYFAQPCSWSTSTPYLRGRSQRGDVDDPSPSLRRAGRARS